MVLNLASSLDEDAMAAGVNANALSRLTEKVATTRQEVAQLVDQLQARQAEQQERQRARIPGMPDGGLFDNQRTELDKAARRIMQEADVDAAMATADFRVSAPYLPPDATREETGAGSNSGGSAGVADP